MKYILTIGKETITVKGYNKLYKIIREMVGKDFCCTFNKIANRTDIVGIYNAEILGYFTS